MVSLKAFVESEGEASLAFSPACFGSPRIA